MCFCSRAVVLKRCLLVMHLLHNLWGEGTLKTLEQRKNSSHGRRRHSNFYVKIFKNFPFGTCALALLSFFCDPKVKHGALSFYLWALFFHMRIPILIGEKNLSCMCVWWSIQNRSIFILDYFHIISIFRINNAHNSKPILEALLKWKPLLYPQHNRDHLHFLLTWLLNCYGRNSTQSSQRGRNMSNGSRAHSIYLYSFHLCMFKAGKPQAL